MRAVDAEALYERRVALGMSVATLAAATGVGQATIYRLEAGQTNARLATLQRLAKALRTDVERLLDESRVAA